MKTKNFICQLALCLLAILSAACEQEEDFDKKYGSGSPLAENIITVPELEYTYNDDRLVTQIHQWITETDDEGNDRKVLKLKAEIAYPKSDRAVMTVHDEITFTYVFAFGENHFANRIIETDDEGSYLYKIDYDKEGHITRFTDSVDELNLEWTNGNLTKVIDKKGDYDAYTVITYGTRTNFAQYKLNPFLLNVNLGPFMSTLNWWFECGLDYALYIGFLGEHSINLPETLTSYDNVNEEPWKAHMEYNEFGWVLREDH